MKLRKGLSPRGCSPVGRTQHLFGDLVPSQCHLPAQLMAGFPGLAMAHVLHQSAATSFISSLSTFGGKPRLVVAGENAKRWLSAVISRVLGFIVCLEGVFFLMGTGKE